MADWRAAGSFDRIPPGGGSVAFLDGLRIALFRVGERVFAIDDVCPHMGASLAGGVCQDGVVACPLHGWRFRISDGAWISVPKIKLRTFPTDVRDRVVYVDVAPPSATPAASESAP